MLNFPPILQGKKDPQLVVRDEPFYPLPDIKVSGAPVVKEAPKIEFPLTSSLNIVKGYFKEAFVPALKKSGRDMFNVDKILRTSRAGTQLASTPFAWGLDRVQGGDIEYSELADENFKLAKKMFAGESYWGENVVKVGKDYLKRREIDTSGVWDMEDLKQVEFQDIVNLSSLAFFHYLGDPFLEATAYSRMYGGMKEALLFKKFIETKKFLKPNVKLLQPRNVTIPVIKDGKNVVNIKTRWQRSEMIIEGWVRRNFKWPMKKGLPAAGEATTAEKELQRLLKEETGLIVSTKIVGDDLIITPSLSAKLLSDQSGFARLPSKSNLDIPATEDVATNMAAKAREHDSVEAFIDSQIETTFRTDYRWSLTKVRGGWTKPKIKKELSNITSESGTVAFNREILKFNSPAELAQNFFYHGSGGGISGLKPSITQRGDVVGGGGYGEKYWGISLSKDRNMASQFTAMSRTGGVAPVILKKGAVVKDLENIEDAVEIEDIIESLWDEGIDAVRIGKWDSEFSEQELVVLNPKAIVVGSADYFPVYQKPKMPSFDENRMTGIFDNALDEFTINLQKQQAYKDKEFLEKYGRERDKSVRGHRLNRYAAEVERKRELTRVWNEANLSKTSTAKPEAPIEKASERTKVNMLEKGVGRGKTLSKNTVSTKLGQAFENTKKMLSRKPPNDRAIADSITPDHIELPKETKWQGFRRYVEDFNIRLKILNKEIEKASNHEMPEWLDLYAKKDMMPRVQSDLVRRVEQEKLDFVKELVANNISVEELDDLLHAQHAKERNREMNMKRLDRKKETEDGLSGMTDETADNIIKTARPEVFEWAIKARKISEETLSFELDRGLIKFEDYLKLDKTYDNYVPLFRELDSGSDHTGIGQGVSITGAESKAAYGSTKRVVSPLGNIFYRKQRALIRDMKNQIGVTIIGLVRRHREFESIFKVEKEPVALIAKRKITAEIDVPFFQELVAFAKSLGLESFKTKGVANRRLGHYEFVGPKIERKFATSRETSSHEVGHFLDVKYSLGDRFSMHNPKTSAVGMEIYKHSMVEQGEKGKRLDSPLERFANAFSWWLVHRDLAADTIPLFSKEMTKIINDIPELKPLLEIKPTARVATESMMLDIWGKVFRFGDNVIGAKIKGAQYFITIKDTKIAMALKNLELARLNPAMKFLRNMLGIWSGFKTRWRPEFIMTNFERDFGEGMINLGVEKDMLGPKGKNLRRDVAKGIFKAQREIYKYLKGNKEGNGVADNFFRLGGDVGHFWLEKAQDAEKSMIQLEKELMNKGIEKIKNPIRRAGEFVDHVQTMIELGIRFSAYKELTKRGMSMPKAIQRVADLTVNFSRQGQVSPTLKALYGFINPAIQGTSKVFRTTTSKTGRKRIIKSLFALVALGFMTRTASILIDEEGDDQINDWAKNNRLSMATGNGRTITLWNMPYGFSTFYSIGSNLSLLSFGKVTWAEAFKSMFETAVSSFSPFQTDLNSFVPTLARPIWETNSNKAWYDGPVHPEQVFTNTPKPNSQSYFNNTSKGAIFISALVNRLTGGSDTKAGFVDIYPNDLQYMYNQWFGGPFEFVTSSIEAGAKSLKGEFDINKTPFVRQVIRDNKPEQWSYGTIYDTLERAWKKDLSKLEKDRFYSAVALGLEKKIFDRDKANTFIQDFIKAQYQIVGSIRDNGAKLNVMDPKDRNLLLESYSERTRPSILKAMRESYEADGLQKPEDIDAKNFDSKDESSFIDRVKLYAEAIGTDPVTAFNRIFTGQRIRKLENGAIIVERMPVSESQGIKQDMGAVGGLMLDHVIPLQLGGSNSEKNLQLVEKEIWSQYTVVENYLGRLLRDDKISKKDAQKAIKDYKKGKITEEEIRDKYK